MLFIDFSVAEHYDSVHVSKSRSLYILKHVCLIPVAANIKVTLF